MIAHFHAMARYNRWQNQRLYQHAASLTDEQRRRDMGAFFRSIHGTFNHLLLADRLWMGRFTGEPFQVESLDQELYADFATLREERAREDERILAWVDGLSPADLDGELTFTSMSNPQTRRMAFWFALSHFFNHQTHHRGQVTTLLHQLGVDPGVTDLLRLPDEAG